MTRTTPSIRYTGSACHTLTVPWWLTREVHEAIPATKKMSVSLKCASMASTLSTTCAAAGEKAYLPRRPMSSPKVTTASTPDTPNTSSASEKQPYTAMMSTATSTRKSFSTNASHETTTSKMATPTAAPPRARRMKKVAPLLKVCGSPPPCAALCSTLCRKMPKSTIALPSFNRDSPSITSASFSGAPMECSVATTATGSVAHTIEPNVSATFQSHSPPSASEP
mmetsp:Transcript_42444/g.104526  ORF Transcript_42444/g.104526 Transcript_42444/m.104526 type:complete len:224 (-) Transcript_42444:304-975(-)